MSGTQDRPVYLTALGAFFPGKPVSNAEMEDYLGRIHGRPSKWRKRVLEKNGIRTRHYAIDRRQRSLFRNSEMAALAVRGAVERAGLEASEIDFLAAATTQGDLLVPGFASMVHGELATPPVEVASLHGVCGSGVAALQAAHLQVKAGAKRVAVACASEFPSRLFKASRYESQGCAADELAFDTEFLRWMLSDGAGAAVLAPEPSPHGLSLRVEWIDLRSHAGEQPVCMTAGASPGEDGDAVRSWLDEPSFASAASIGAINLKQDVRQLDGILRLGVERYRALIAAGRLDPDTVDWVVCHYSSELFRSRIFALMREEGLPVHEDRWFSNLATRGNVGSASSFVLLEELMRHPKLAAGQQVLLMVPESGRSLLGFVLFRVVGPERVRKGETQSPVELPAGDDRLQRLGAELAAVWADYQRSVLEVPIVRRLLGSSPGLDDYRTLLFGLRQQVVEGARWIARAASSFDSQALELRSMVLAHARDEHRDYEMLETDFVAVGGELPAIRGGEKNAGSEALSAWMFQQASRPNPLDLLGAMFIIEGTGRLLAGRLSAHLAERLALAPDQLRFLTHHAEHDGGHLDKLVAILRAGVLDDAGAAAIVRTARITARLYRLQLEELAAC